MGTFKQISVQTGLETWNHGTLEAKRIHMPSAHFIDEHEDPKGTANSGVWTVTVTTPSPGCGIPRPTAGSILPKGLKEAALHTAHLHGERRVPPHPTDIRLLRPGSRDGRFGNTPCQAHTCNFCDACLPLFTPDPHPHSFNHSY